MNLQRCMLSLDSPKFPGVPDKPPPKVFLTLGPVALQLGDADDVHHPKHWGGDRQANVEGRPSVVRVVHQ